MSDPDHFWLISQTTYTQYISLLVCFMLLVHSLQSEAAGSEREPSVGSAGRAVCSEGDSSAGGGWEAAAGAGEDPAVRMAGSGEKKNLLVLIFWVLVLSASFLSDPNFPFRLKAATKSCLCSSAGCSQRRQLSGTPCQRWAAWTRPWLTTKLSSTPTSSRWSGLTAEHQKTFLLRINLILSTVFFGL